ncbi:hypothetical protein AMTRI_Chr06g199240 [Amborella trichopoda]
MATKKVCRPFLLLFFASYAAGGVLFSTLKPTLVVQASPRAGSVLNVGEDRITVTWSLNQSFPKGMDQQYKKIKVKLCYAPISQKDRAWRKTVDDIKKDKTCQFKIAAQPYNSTATVAWLIERDTPTATYFIRTYALDSHDNEVTYGQTTNKNKTTNLFVIQGISGRQASLDVAAAVFSVFSVFSLFGFFIREKWAAKRVQRK